jgi:hypothetical protein
LSSAIGVIQGFHAVMGGLRGEPHWFINDADAHRFGQAMANAARHFPVKAAQKTIDVATLLIVGFAVETPRVVRSIQLARMPQPAAPRGPAQVFQFHSPNLNTAQPSPAASATPAQSPNSPLGGTPGASGAPSDFAVGPQDGGGFGGDAAE